MTQDMKHNDMKRNNGMRDTAAWDRLLNLFTAKLP